MLPVTTPASIRLLFVDVWKRIARRRLHDIGDARIEMEDAFGARRGGPPGARLLAAFPPHGAHFAGVWLSWSCLPSPALSSGK